ncbi:MAG: exodeoxyribonuclease VII large subunit [Clostridia bacterium]|nr:exodeoxyribonuclease VII large subunit [Clostridia bacterium]
MNQMLTVSQLNSYIMGIISKDEKLSDVAVSGEISNYKRHSSGHLYFTLKDDRSVIRCVMFKSNTANLNFEPVDGQKVLVKGYVSVYEKSGYYQIYASDISLKGEGDLYLEFEKMKKKLAASGYFSLEHKKKIPYLPNAIGIITSDTGAVINDILNVLNRRFNTYNILLYPSKVQGDSAHKEIIRGLKYFNTEKNVDVIILARGGGSIEDLWPFNEYDLALAIFDSEIPVISAVGHETDFTIADFVSDLRAPTPSAAAELVLPNKDDINRFISNNAFRLNNAYLSMIEKKQRKIEEYKSRPVLRRPEEYLNIIQMNLDSLTDKLNYASNNIIKRHELSFLELASKMETLSPLATINRGYAVVEDLDGNILTSVKRIKNEELIRTRMKDGSLTSKVIDREVNNG